MTSAVNKFVMAKNGYRRYVTRLVGKDYFEDDGKVSRLPPSDKCRLRDYEDTDLQTPMLPHQIDPSPTYKTLKLK